MTEHPIDEPLILTLDIGTSSSRAMLFDRTSHALPGFEARVESVVRTTPDGGVEMDAEGVLDGVMACIDQVLQRLGSDAHRIVAVGCDTLVSNVMGIDRESMPVTPLYTWADTRSSADAAQLRAENDEAAIHNRTGCLLRSSYLPAQLRWLRRTQPDMVARVTRWVSIGELLHLRCFGTATVSYSVASWTGMLDRRALHWDEQMLHVAGITASQLSPLSDHDQPVIGLLSPYAQRWPSLQRVPWFPAVGDVLLAVSVVVASSPIALRWRWVRAGQYG